MAVRPPRHCAACQHGIGLLVPRPSISPRSMASHVGTAGIAGHELERVRACVGHLREPAGGIATDGTPMMVSRRLASSNVRVADFPRSAGNCWRRSCCRSS